MQLEHEFVVPVPVDQAWDVLLDVERIAPCMPGATVDSFDGETVTGRVKVKVGPIQVTYTGQAKFVEKDRAGLRVVLDAHGKEARGAGTAAAKIEARLIDEGGASTRVTVNTDLAITGKPAQFGRGVMVEVGNKLLGRFADCLASEIQVGSGGTETSGDSTGEASGASGGGAAEEAAAAAVSAPASPEPQARPSPAPSQVTPTPIRRSSESEAIDLLDVAGLAVIKRVVVAGLGLVVLLVLWRLLRRR